LGGDYYTVVAAEVSEDEKPGVALYAHGDGGDDGEDREDDDDLAKPRLAVEGWIWDYVNYVNVGFVNVCALGVKHYVGGI